MALVLAACHGLGAKARENPLDRLTPVPADQPIPAIDFFRPPVFSSPELNPGGTMFAALVSTGADRFDLLTFDLATLKADRLSGGENYDIFQFGWLNDSRLLFSIGKDKRYAHGLYATNIGRLSRVNMLQAYNVVDPIGFPRADPHHLIVWIRHSAYDQGGDRGLVRIDTRRGAGAGSSLRVDNSTGFAAKVVRRYPAPPGGAVRAYIAGLDGEPAFAVAITEGRLTLFLFRDETWKASPVDPEAYPLVELSDNPGELLVLGPRTGDKPRAVHRMNAETGTLGDMVFSDPEYDVTNIHVLRSADNGRLLGAEYDRKGPEAIWLDPDYQAAHQAIQRQFDDQVVRILGGDRAGQHFFFVTGSDRHPETFYLFDKAKPSINHITNTAPWIDPARMRPMQLISYKARDGRKIDGYLTLPEGASKESPPPAVVLPHGGPWSRDTWRWDPEAQFLASRGYAVFQPNYRGSPGTAWRFPEEDLWAFRKMHDDVTDGVRALTRAGLIDASRVAIMGSSFGGYLAVCGVAFEPELYRCGITVAGIFDWERVIKETKRNIYRRGFYGTLVRRLGDPKKAQETFESISPLRAIANIKVPVFVAHGTEDHVAAVAQSRRLIGELKRNKVTYEAQIERAEGHGFHNLDARVELYERVESFLRQHLATKADGN